MRYMLMICGDEPDHEKSPEDVRNDPEGFVWFEEMDRRGVLRGGNRLRPGSAATGLREANGKEDLWTPFAVEASWRDHRWRDRHLVPEHCDREARRRR